MIPEGQKIYYFDHFFCVQINFLSMYEWLAPHKKSSDVDEKKIARPEKIAIILS